MGTTHFEVVADQGAARHDAPIHYSLSVALKHGEEVWDFLQSVYGRSTVELGIHVRTRENISCA
jgi:hypothetical protein